MSWLSKLFNRKSSKKTEDEKVVEFFRQAIKVREDVGKIEINPDLAFRDSEYRKLLKKYQDLEVKVLGVTPDDYKNLEFDDEINLNNYNLSNLSEETKREIVKLIRLDIQRRIDSRPKT